MQPEFRASQLMEIRPVRDGFTYQKEVAVKNCSTIRPDYRCVADDLGITNLSLEQIIESTIHLQALFDEIVDLLRVSWVDSRCIQIPEISIECGAGKVNDLMDRKVTVACTVINYTVNKLRNIDGRKRHDHRNHHQADCDYQLGLQSHWTSQLLARVDAQLLAGSLRYSSAV